MFDWETCEVAWNYDVTIQTIMLILCILHELAIINAMGLVVQMVHYVYFREWNEMCYWGYSNKMECIAI